VLLKTASPYFVLHNIIVLPARISDKFAQYLLDFPYLGLDNIQATISCLHKQNYVTAGKAVLLCVCLSRRQTTTYCIWENCSCTTKFRPCSDTILGGCVITLSSKMSHSPVGSMVLGHLAAKYSQEAAYYTILPDVPSLPVDSKRCRNYWETQRRFLTHHNCLYPTRLLSSRVTNYEC
jgi:hypothetical protein